MKKYRIKAIGNCDETIYIPQCKTFLIWKDFVEENFDHYRIDFYDIEKAKEFIHNRKIDDAHEYNLKSSRKIEYIEV